MLEKKALQERKLFLGIVLTLLSSFFYALYSLLAKWTQQKGINIYQITFFTFFISWNSPRDRWRDIIHLD